MTYLQLVNAVLKRLRESEAVSVSQSAYTKLIGELVNETKREVEDAHNWILLRDTIQVTTSNDTFRYTLTGAGNRFRTLHVFNDTQDVRMMKIPAVKMTEYHNGGETQNSAPIYYDYNGSSLGDPNVDLWPIPDGAYVLNFDMVIPQDDFTADTDELTVPSWPVILGAYSKALSERGEDGGQQFGEALSAYNLALSDAIAHDAANIPREMDWVVE